MVALILWIVAGVLFFCQAVNVRSTISLGWLGLFVVALNHVISLL